MTTPDINMDEVRGWAVAAGQLARQYFNNVASTRKADRSIVTEADKAVEHQIVASISARYPSHGILGEEQTSRELDREFVWVVDPIDGTASFVSGLGSWCVSIGLLRAGTPYLGVIYLPLLDDCYYAGPENVAYLNNHPIHVISPETWEDEHWLATPATLHRRFDLDFVGKTRVLGSTAAQMCYVARGSALGALLVDAHPWDIAAGLVIVRAAGGVVVPLDTTVSAPGNLLGDTWHTRPLLAAHPEQIGLLQQAFSPRNKHAIPG